MSISRWTKMLWFNAPEEEKNQVPTPEDLLQ